MALRKELAFMPMLTLLIAGAAATFLHAQPEATLWTFDAGAPIIALGMGPAGETAVITGDRIEVLDRNGRIAWAGVNPNLDSTYGGQWQFLGEVLLGQTNNGWLTHGGPDGTVRQTELSLVPDSIQFLSSQPRRTDLPSQDLPLSGALLWLSGQSTAGLELQGYDAEAQLRQRITLTGVDAGYSWTVGPQGIYGLDDTKYNRISDNESAAYQAIELLALNLDGSLQWRLPLAQLTTASEPIPLPGGYLTVSWARQLVVLDAAGEQVHANAELQVRAMAVAVQGRAYACTDKGLLELAPTGAILNQAPEQADFCGLRITPQGLVCAWTHGDGKHSRTLYIYDAELKLRQQRPLPAGAFLAYLPDGALVLTDVDRVECFRP
jgi:hypothetical protein